MYCTVGWAGLLYCSLCASCCTAASTYDCSSWAKACNPVVVASIRTLFLLFSTRTSFPARWIARTSETAPVCVLRLYCFRICCATPGKNMHIELRNMICGPSNMQFSNVLLAVSWRGAPSAYPCHSPLRSRKRPSRQTSEHLSNSLLGFRPSLRMPDLIAHVLRGSSA